MLEAFTKEQLGLGLKLLRQHVEKLANAEITSRYEMLIQDYAYLVRFMADGYKDPQRDKLYGEMLVKGYHLSSDIKRLMRIANDTALVSLRKSIEAKDNNVTILIEDLRNETLDEKTHYEVLNRAFISIFLSHDWREQEQRLWTSYLLSADVNPIDAQVIISAIMLGCMLGYCFEKYKTLCCVFMASENVHVRERALVGWALCYNKGGYLPKQELKEQNALVGQMLEDDDTCSELVELIMQVVICTEAEKDNRIIQKEIMPDLLKGNHISFLAKGGFVEKDESMDDILNPGKAELEMEKMELGIQKMAKMQKAGADVFYSGFSQMKRYPFFYKLLNWFVPFDGNHPDLADLMKDEELSRVVSSVLGSPALCNSDKYSYIFVLKNVLPTFPDEIRKLLVGGDLSIGGVPFEFSGTKESAYVRRIYLHDLYRFFNLSPQVKMPNIFTDNSWMLGLICTFKALSKNCVELGKFLLRHDKIGEAFQVVCCGEQTEERALVMAAIDDKKGNDPSGNYMVALAMNGSSIPALKGLVRYYLQQADEKVLAYSQKLCALCPGVFAYEVNRLHAYVVLGQIEENMNDFYRMDFEHPDDPKVKRLIAWALLCLGRFDKAEEQYKRILERKWGEVTRNDLLCIIDLYFFSGDMKKCIEACCNYIDAYPLKGEQDECQWHDLYSILSDEFKLLGRYHSYSPYDVSILVDAVLGT